MRELKFIISFVLIIVFLPSEAQSPALINGVFNIYKEKIYVNNNIQDRNSATAYFSYTAVPVVSPDLFAKAGNVKLNDKKLKYNNDKNFYGSHLKKNNDDPDDEDEECNNTSPIDPMHWKVSGHGTIPQMNFIYNSVFPEFNGNIILPPTVKKTDTLFIQLNSVNNADSIYIKVWDSFFNGENRKYLTFAFGYNSIPLTNGSKLIYIPPALLSPLNAGNNSFISVEASKNNYQIVAGKNFLFNTVTAIKKPIISITN